MNYSAQQIELMASVVGLRVESFGIHENVWAAPADSGENADGEWNGLRSWQPWSDWRDLGPLYLACMEFCSSYPMAPTVRDHCCEVGLEAEGGEFDRFATAVCNLAVEIGRTL